MFVTIARVHENLFSGTADSLTAPTTEGLVTILPKHEPLVANLKAGELIVRAHGEEKKFNITDGVLEVSGDQATVIL